MHYILSMNSQRTTLNSWGIVNSQDNSCVKFLFWISLASCFVIMSNYSLARTWLELQEQSSFFFHISCIFILPSSTCFCAGFLIHFPTSSCAGCVPGLLFLPPELLWDAHLWDISCPAHVCPSSCWLSAAWYSLFTVSFVPLTLWML